MAYTAPISNTPGFAQHRRKSQVFVEIPPSPLFKGRVVSTSFKVDVSHQPESEKENAAPLSTKTSLNNIPTNKEGKGKRKAQDDEDPTTQPDAKKVKVFKPNDDSTLSACHQCRAKRHPDSILQCTRISKTTGNRCKASYCDICLRNRYGEELKTISQSSVPASREGHADTDYHFVCPRCDGICNCAPCRKRQGLAPVGKFTSAQGQGSVREILERNPQASGLLPKNTVIPVPKLPKATESQDVTNLVKTTANAPKAQNVKSDTAGESGRRRKKVPEPVWVGVPQMWTKHEVEDRIYLREFILRFNPILNIGVRNLEELDDFSSLHDPSTKAILLALLDLIAIEDETHKRNIQAKIKIIRGLGLNWAKIVPVLYGLRGSVPAGHALSTLPDLDRSDLEVSYNTRGARTQGLHADQLFSILLHLVQVTGEGASVRQELEEGSKQAKEARAAHLKAMREETERWADVREELTEKKPVGEKKGKTNTDIIAWKVKFRKAEAEHKAIISNIHNSYKPQMDCCAPRFTSLGCDTNGRTYYALSASGPQRGKKERLPTEGERSSMKKWGWFIAVFGKPGTVVQQTIEDDSKEEEEGEDPSAERWWGFADVEEMRKLSKWLAYCAEHETRNDKEGTKSSGSSTTVTATSGTLASRLPSPSEALPISRTGSRPVSPTSNLSVLQADDHDGMDINGDEPARGTDMSRPPTSVRMKTLAKAVLEFADFVDWRLNRESSGAKSGIVAENFYGEDAL